MKTFRFSLLAATLATATVSAQETDRSVLLEPKSGAISTEQIFTVHFPDAMIGVEAIDQTGQEAPLSFKPAIEGEFFWKSQTEGRFRITGPVIPGTDYTVFVRGGLKALDGKAAPAFPEKIALRSAPLTVDGKHPDWNANLPAEPVVRLLFNYAIDYEAARESIYFKDRHSGQRIAANLVLPHVRVKAADPSPEVPKTGTDLSAEPAQPLPVGRTVDLIVDGLRDAATGTPVPFLKSFPLGTTTALRVEEVYANCEALVAPSISIRTNTSVDLETVTADTVLITPEVPNLKRLGWGYNIVLQGDFNLTERYTITLLPPLANKAGFALGDPIARTIEFEGYSPSIYFPSQQFFQRSALGLNVKFLHANTREVTWSLAPIPDHKLSIVRDRLYSDSELVLPSLGLEPVASGIEPGTSAVEAVYGDLVWKPQAGQPMLSGAYLLEVHAPVGDSGKVAAHRAVIFFNDLYITQKRTSDEVILKLSRMADSTPVANATVRAVRDDNGLRQTATSDADGIARFPKSLFDKEPYVSFFLVDSDAGRAVQYAYGNEFPNSGWADESHAQKFRASIIPDRNLYRPGTLVKFKGFVRAVDAGGNLTVPAGHQVQWNISAGGEDEIVAQGTARTDDTGGWEGEWDVPADQKLGGYTIKATTEGEDTGYAWVRVEEYRVPLFNVEVGDDTSNPGPTLRIPIQSNYFHGGANAGANAAWSLSWNAADGPPWDGFKRADTHSENHPPHPSFDPQSGTLRLDANGSALLEVAVPAMSPYTHSLYSFSLSVDVTSPEGRTITSGNYGIHSVVPVIPAIDTDTDYTDGPAVSIQLKATDPKGEAVEGEPMTVDVYRVDARTVKEKLSPGIFRYRNFDEFEIVATEKAVSGKTLVVPAPKPGRYVSVARLDNLPDAPAVSDKSSVAGEAPAAYPVTNTSTFAATPDKKEYFPGETAMLALEAPFSGKAWVCVETDRIVDQWVVDVPENGARVDIPIKPEYYPNVWATVYLVKPGGPDHLPAERLARQRIEVKRADLQLDVAPSLAKSDVEPGDSVSGIVLVSSEGKPVADADLTLIAVDEAVLQLGGWSVPDLLNAFYPFRSHGVETSRALDNHFESFDESDVVEKGVLIGGGGEGGAAKKQLRKDFVARAFWKTQVRTDAEGKAAFDFTAPDNLTAFRVTAIAATKSSQFGHGDTKFTISKRLMVEPSLPRFARFGDTLELRAVVRQTAEADAKVVIHCTVSGGISLGVPTLELNADTKSGVPSVFRFPAKVTSREPAVIRFESSLAGNSEITDAVEITLPVHEPGILQKTGRYGEAPAGAETFVLADHVPDFWPDAQGSFSLTLSHSPWIPKLTGLPVILDYPHGCFEQKGSRYLGYTILASLLNYLPDLQGRHDNYAKRLTQGLEEYEGSLLSGGYLPYWPGSSTPDYFVTVLAAWVMENARQAGTPVPARLDTELTQALDSIIRGRTPNVGQSLRSFALFVHSEKPGAKADHNDILRDFYLHREKFDDESRAFLALAMKNYGVLPDEMAQLAREIDQPLKPHAFDPDTFYSTTRAEAIVFLALARIGGPEWVDGAGNEARERLLTALDSSINLSTQENLWLLIAFNAMHQKADFGGYKAAAITPAPEQVSANQVSLAWQERGLDKIRDLAVNLGKDGSQTYYLVDASVLLEGENMKREDRGLRVERVVKNLTDASRLGTKEAPFRIGDEVLVSYRILAKKNQYFAALVDELPAALETVNFNLAQVSQFYELPEEFANTSLWLDHSELRDRSANLYFNRIDAGQHQYSILARATSVGTFTWPCAALTPMYEPRFGALSDAGQCYVTE
jgi:uncharacterized protein YfaS (alpha-2-macroglobulin family)